jgi:hypothetical protein
MKSSVGNLVLRQVDRQVHNQVWFQVERQAFKEINQ